MDLVFFKSSDDEKGLCNEQPYKTYPPNTSVESFGITSREGNISEDRNSGEDISFLISSNDEEYLVQENLIKYTRDNDQAHMCESSIVETSPN